MQQDTLTERILHCAFKVHSALGMGLLESVYELALAHELRKMGLAVATQVEVPVVYDGVRLGLAFRADMIVEREVILELKSVEALAPAHSKQLTNYLKLSGLKTGLLLNFNTIHLRTQIVRISI